MQTWGRESQNAQQVWAARSGVTGERKNCIKSATHIAAWPQEISSADGRTACAYKTATGCFKTLLRNINFCSK